MIDVVWYANAEGIAQRGYWDGGWLEAIFDRSLWRVPHAHEFTHRAGFAELPEDADGAVVIVPGRWHVEPEQVDEIQKHIDSLGWCLLIVTGVEEDDFPCEKLTHPNMEVWTQTPMPHYDRGKRKGVPDFWPPDCPRILAEIGDRDRTLDWSFAGQINTQGRQTLEEHLRTMEHGALFPTDTFGSGLPYDEYLELMACSKVVPCPSGPFSVDTFRLFEALEAGCVPVVDEVAPNVLKSGYWEKVLGEIPFPKVTKWKQFPYLLKMILEGWPANANRIGAWWQGYKRLTAWAFNDAIQRLSDSRGGATSASDEVTVLIPTSPCAMHPSTAAIEETVASVRERLPYAEIILMMDGVRGEQKRLAKDYEEYRRRVLHLSEHVWANVLPIYFDSFSHQAVMTHRALEEVRTPTVLFVEHDCPLIGEIPFEQMVDAIVHGGADVIRLHHEASVLPDHEHMMLDAEPKEVCGVPLRRTTQWSQRPHLASTGFYRRLIADNFDPDSRTMIEDTIHGTVHNAWREFGLAGWDRYRIHLFCPDGDIKRSGHLDTRGAEPKYEMVP